MTSLQDALPVLVTGGAGYIGSHAVLALRDAGRPVVVIDNLVTGFRWAVPDDVPFVEGDVADDALVRRTLTDHGIGAILHFAGSVVVPESVTDPLKYYRNNTAASRSLIESAVTAGVGHFLFSSTAATYGIPQSSPVAEDAPTRPINPYGMSKLMTEAMLADVSHAHPMNHAALRYFNVAGADPQGRSGQSTAGATHLIKVAVEAALGKRDGVSVHGTDYATPDGTGVRDYIHVTDLIAAHALLLRHLRQGGDSTTINCAYGQGYSVRQVVDMVRAVSGVQFPVIEGPRRAGDPASVTATGQKARQLLGWVPRLNDLGIIVETAFAWEQHLMLRNR